MNDKFNPKKINDFYQKSYVRIIFEFYALVFKMCIIHNVPPSGVVDIFDTVEQGFQQGLTLLNDNGEEVIYLGMEELDGSGMILGPEYMMRSVSQYMRDPSIINRYAIWAEKPIEPIPEGIRKSLDYSYSTTKSMVRMLPPDLHIDFKHVACTITMMQCLAVVYSEVLLTVIVSKPGFNMATIREYLPAASMAISSMMADICKCWSVDIERQYAIQARVATKLIKTSEIYGTSEPATICPEMFDAYVVCCEVLPAVKK